MDSEPDGAGQVMTPESQKNGSWQPPAAAQAAAYELFKGVIPDLKQLATGYRVGIEMVDNEIYALFCHHMREILEGLAAALAGTDERATRAYAHSIEGMGGSLGFPEISVAGAALSRSAQTGGWQDCQIIHKRLEQWLWVAEAGTRTGDSDHE